MISQNAVSINYKPRAHALDFHARTTKNCIMVWHRRAGKTVACVADLLEKAIRNPLPMPQYAYIAPTYKQAKKIAWRYIKSIGEPIIKKVMESELSVELVNGAVITLFGADNPDSLRGLYFDGVVVDEYGDISPMIFGEILAPAMADRDGWIVFIGTPKGPNHFFELWESSEGHPEWFRKSLKASESGVFTKKRLSAIRNQPGMDEDTYNQEFEVDWHAANKGSYYAKQLNELEAAGHKGVFPWNPKYPVHTGWDLGWSDDTSIWFAQRINGRIHIVDFFTVSGYSIEEIVDVLRSKPYIYGEFYLPHDAKSKSLQTGKSIREQLWGLGINSTIVPKLGVQDGIQAVRATLPEVYFNSGNEDVRIGYSALLMYQRQFDETRRVYKQNPLHNWASNPADGFRYLCLGMNGYTAKKEAEPIKTVKNQQQRGPVMCLDNLFSDREASLKRSGGRI